MILRLLVSILFFPMLVSASFVREAAQFGNDIVVQEILPIAHPNIRYVLNVGGPVACGFAAEAQDRSKKEHLKLFATMVVYAAAVSYFPPLRSNEWDKAGTNFKKVLAKYCVGFASGRFRRVVMNKFVSKPASKSEAVAVEFADAGGCCCN